jgi:hypothetical protein
MKLPGLTDLTFMACLDKPLDVVDQQRPPEAQKETGPDGEDTLVPEVVVSLLYQSVPLPFWHN